MKINPRPDTQPMPPIPVLSLPRRHPGRKAACLLLLSALVACAAEPQPVTALPAGPQRLALVQTLIGSASCQTDAECRTVAIGHKSCGGPEAYLAWSTAVTNAEALAPAVADHNAAQQAAQVTDGRVSNCQFVVDPGAVCRAAPAPAGGIARTCQLQGSAGRGGPASR